jgi:tetratricopeptide (TPR) repeat protein
VIGEGSMTSVSDLFRRRVPQILGVYLAAGWGMLEFTDWVVNRYSLSPHLIDLSLVAWALMIPTVLILAYFHGAPGRDRWTRVEKIGIPVNVLVAATVLVVMFAGRELGPVTRSVTVEDETGATVEREIPKSEFRKSLAIFHFDNATQDDSLDWLQYGIPLALQFDLSQDYFIDFRYHPHFSQRLKEEGYGDGTGVPLTLRRDIAEHFHMDHFVTGTLNRRDGALQVDVTLYNTHSGKPIGQHSYPLSDPLNLTDRISLQIKQDLGIPESHIEEAEDLPVAELMTTARDAFRSFVEAYGAAYVEGDWAVSTDPGFAAAHLERFQAYTLINESDKGLQALETAMRQLYRLPERIRLGVKTQYYWLVKQDIEKAKATAAMHTELLPEDAAAHVQLATFHQLQREYDRAIAGYTRALELDPGQVELLLRIAEIYRESGDLEAALKYYRRYTEESPRDPRGFTALGDLYRLMGDHAGAREAYERALLLEGEHVPALVHLARLEVNVGEFPAAERHLQEALDDRRTASRGLRGVDELREAQGTSQSRHRTHAQPLVRARGEPAALCGAAVQAG